jgi:hypothetical protein
MEGTAPETLRDSMKRKLPLDVVETSSVGATTFCTECKKPLVLNADNAFSKVTDNDHAMLRALADPNTRDPIGDAAQEIVDELRREICDRETPWHEDGTLTDIVEQIIREKLEIEP